MFSSTTLFPFCISLLHRVDKEDFRILFEIVPNGLSGENRGHVSIDNLRLRSCFDEKPFAGHCEANQLKCNESKVAVCIHNNRICDLVDDCDDKEDENMSCGRCSEVKLHIRKKLKFLSSHFQTTSLTVACVTSSLTGVAGKTRDRQR